jgi:hypothetical protein
MTKRRQERRVTITGEQRRRLEQLWFYYGNYGPKSTPGNHSFIQGFLEHGIDTRNAVQLAAALHAQARARGLPSLILITADEDLLTAANAEGLTTDNPNIH